MSRRTCLVFVVAAALPIGVAFAACSADGTYRGGGRQNDPYGNGALQVLDTGPDSPRDSGVVDTGADTQG